MPSLASRSRRGPRRAAVLACLGLLAPVAASARQEAPERTRHHAPAHPAPGRQAPPHGRTAAHGAAAHPARSGVHPGTHAGAHAGAHTGAHPGHRPAPHAPVPVPAPPPAVLPPVPPPPPPPQKGTSTGLPLPRFAALRADTVNLRSGPGTRYPIQWVYKRRDLPVEVEREFDVWRLVLFADGTKGWVNQATLIGTRTFLVTAPGAGLGRGAGSGPEGGPESGPGSETPAADGSGGSGGAPGGMPPGTLVLRGRPDADGPVVALVRPGVVGRLRSCAAGSGWCRVSIRDYTGWLPRPALWGLMSDETISPP